MNNRFVKIGEAAKLLGVSVQALRNWEVEGKIMPSHRTPGGQRMSDLADLLGVNDLTYPTIAYARVSSSDQKKDLERQHAVLEAFCDKNGWQTEIIRDLGSGMNYNNQGLGRLLELMVHGQMSRLVITHKDRLLRFGAEIVFRICELKGIEVVIINKGEQPTFEEELTRDVMEIMTVFCAKLYGRRSHKSKKMAEEIENIVSEEKQQLELNLGPPNTEDRTESE
jgi:predicted site-specific integrase-resolvase